MKKISFSSITILCFLYSLWIFGCGGSDPIANLKPQPNPTTPTETEEVEEFEEVEEPEPVEELPEEGGYGNPTPQQGNYTPQQDGQYIPNGRGGGTYYPPSEEGGGFGETPHYVDEYTFTASQKSVKHVNMLWAIDNSLDMKRKGIDEFVINQVVPFIYNYAQQINIGVISAVKSTEYCVETPAIETKLPVPPDHGWSMPPIPGITTFDCVIERISPIKSLTQLIKKDGKLTGTSAKDFFNPLAYTAIIVVSNHPSFNYRAKLFRESAQDRFHPSLLGFFSFTGSRVSRPNINADDYTHFRPPYASTIGSTDPCDNVFSTVHTRLSTKLNGLKFDICEPDWTQNLNAIIHHIDKKRSSVFILGDELPDAPILGVMVDEVSLSQKAYGLIYKHPTVLWIDSAVGLTPASTIRVFTEKTP
ncbi:MAG: hypothetical protein OXC44_00265 [Proteobacteria bacterium]|nr:hypothetical protein [Pseudomonadota bacterium]